MNIKVFSGKILPAVAVILSIIRLYLGVKTPLYLQAGAGYDDWLLVSYARSLLSGDWLGSFGQTSLAKSASYSGILALNYRLGISYSFGLIVSYMIASFLMCYALNLLIHSRRFLVVSYIVMIYSPIMFHEENVQKVYRGGYIVVFSLLVIAAVIGLFASVLNGNTRAMFLWGLLCSVTLPVFWFLKEDSIWILPFVVVGLACSAVGIFRSHDNWKTWVIRMMLLMMPIVSLGISMVCYQSMNQRYYGEYTVTDRSGTYFREVIADLMRIEDSNVDQTWITKEMVYKAIAVSPTFQLVEPQIDQMYESGWVEDDGEIHGDIIIWAIREAFNNAGVYANGGAETNNFYRFIDNELDEAFSDGRLQESEGKIYLSDIARGFMPEELKTYYKSRLPEVLANVFTYNENLTTVNAATGWYDGVVIMAMLTNSTFTWADTDNEFQQYDQTIVNLDNWIVSLYQRTGWLMMTVGLMGVFCLLVRTSIELRHHQGTAFAVLLIVIGMILTSGAVIFAVMWFCNFLSIRKVYDYLNAAIPIVEIVELIGGYYFAQTAHIALIKLKNSARI